MKSAFVTASAATALAAAALAATPEEYATAFAELQGCHISMGACIWEFGFLYTEYDPALCAAAAQASVYHENATWFAAYATAEEFAAAEASATLQYARLSDDASVGAFKAALAQGSSALTDILFCEAGRYAIVDGDVEGSSLVDFTFAAPSKLLANPLDLVFPESQVPGLDGGVETLAAASANAPLRVVLSPRGMSNPGPLLASIRARSGVRTADMSSNSVYVEAESAEAFADTKAFLAKQAGVAWVEPMPQHHILNTDSVYVIQDKYYPGPEDPIADRLEGRAPIWSKGVLGQNQVVGVGDTGIDLESCFFADPGVDEHANKQERLAAEPGQVFNYEGHRKVIQYVNYVDGDAGASGDHGTHVAGSVAGKTLDPEAMIPIGAEGSHEAGNFNGMAPEAKIAFFDVGEPGVRGLTIPDDADEFLGPSYSVGARIHTNSWGSSASYQDVGSRNLDKFVFEHQDMLLLFAAANSGDSGPGTVANPGCTKNVLTVGASTNTNRHLLLVQEFKNLAEPYQCGGSTSNYSIDSLDCAENLAYFSSLGPVFDGRIKPEITAPGMWVASADSSDSNGTDAAPICRATAKAGTSMATPTAAGAAALVRQWLQDGFYPTGAAVEANGFSPMASLVRAMMINGADLMLGIFGETDYDKEFFAGQLQEPANMLSGFGRIHLTNVLKVDGNQDGLHQVRLFGDMADMPSFAATGETVEYTERVVRLPTTAFKATLVWNDYPAAIPSAKLLVNDLDLTVTSPSGTVYYPNNLGRADRLNTVEQVEIPVGELEWGEYKVTVKAHKINMDDVAQPFSLVISGEFEDPPGGFNAAIAVPGMIVCFLVVGLILYRLFASGGASASDEEEVQSQVSASNPKFDAEG